MTSSQNWTALDQPSPELMLLNGTSPDRAKVFATTVPQCSVCNSIYRPAIEQWFTQSVKVPTIKSILDEHARGDCGLTTRSIYRHFDRGHCTEEKALILMRTWAKAAELGVDPDTYEESLRQEVNVVDLTLQKFRRRLVDEDFQPDFKDGLAAAKLMHEMSKVVDDKTSLDPNDMYIAISVLMRHVQTIIKRYAPGQVESATDHLRRLLESDPILQDLVAKTKEIQDDEVQDYFDEDEEPEVVEAEIAAIEQRAVPIVRTYNAESDWDDEDDDEA